MKLGKLMFRLSLIANIVLVVWLFSQRARIQQMLSADEQADQRLDGAIDALKNLKDMVRDQDLRLTARNDQLDAFLEERGIYVD
jgi:hypothetical protein